ncbi:MAG: antitoxin VapB family protein [Nanoarchaeota archaeon]
MATKNISITESAYNKLARLKGENESFSIVIERIAGKEKNNIDGFFGILSDKSADSLEKAIMERRKKHKESRMARIKRIAMEMS